MLRCKNCIVKACVVNVCVVTSYILLRVINSGKERNLKKANKAVRPSISFLLLLLLSALL